jgi:hypothetical protein
MRRIAGLTSLLLLLAASAAADPFVRTLHLSVDSLAIRPLGGDTPTRVVFIGSPMTATVTFAVAALPGTKITPREGFELPSARWWESLAWDIRRDGTPEPVTVKPILARQAGSAHAEGVAASGSGPLVRPGERRTAVLRLPELPAGSYTIRIALAGVHAEPYRLLVSTGGENADLRREYARFKTLNSPNTATLRQSLLELAALDPLNAGPWIRLGDLSLNEGSADEIRGYYDHALSVLAERRSMFAAKGNAPVVQAIDAERGIVEQVRALVPRFVANRSSLDMRVELDGGKRYVLAEKASGRIVQVIGASKSGVR